MKKLLSGACSTALAAAGLAAVFAAAAPAFAADVGVTVRISEPGVYGRIDIGRFPQPQLIVTQPVIVQPPQVVVQRPAPVYMWVPPGHRKDWKKHCSGYNACGVPVYFVQDQWYEQKVKGHGKGHDKGYDKKHDKGRDDDGGKGHDKGQGKGHDKGQGKGHDKH